MARTCIQLHRHNQALEQDSLAMQEEKLRLEREAEDLSKRLAAVMTAKYEPHSTEFDAETPIDKVLNVMHSYIDKVGFMDNGMMGVCLLQSCSCLMSVTQSMRSFVAEAKDRLKGCEGAG